MLATYDKGKNKDDNAVSAAVDEDTCIICLQRIRDRYGSHFSLPNPMLRRCDIRYGKERYCQNARMIPNASIVS
jgi:hypothetical protein